MILKLKNEVEQAGQPRKCTNLKTWIRDSLELSQQKDFLRYYGGQFRSKSLDPTILNLSQVVKTSSQCLSNRRNNYRRSRSQPTLDLYDKVLRNYRAINDLKAGMGFNSFLLVNMNSLLDYYLKIKHKYAHDFTITYICIHSIVYTNLHKFETSFNHLSAILTKLMADYSAVKANYQNHATNSFLSNLVVNELEHNHRTNFVFADFHDLKTNFEFMFAHLKSRYPAYFQHPCSSGDPGYVSQYTDSSSSDVSGVRNPVCYKSAHDIFKTNSNPDSDSLYKTLQLVEYFPTFSPRGASDTNPTR